MVWVELVGWAHSLPPGPLPRAGVVWGRWSCCLGLRVWGDTQDRRRAQLVNWVPSLCGWGQA